MSKLQDFIFRRRKELTEALAPMLDERAQLDSKILRLKKELSDLNQAAKAIGLEEQRPELPLAAEPPAAQPPNIKEAVLSVLQDYPNGLTALDILANVNQRFDLGIIRPSLSPQLSRLKQEGKITNSEMIWQRLPQKKEATTND